MISAAARGYDGSKSAKEGFFSIMKKCIIALLALCIALPLAFVPEEAGAASFETVIKKGVNFRAAPSTSAYIYRLLPKGERVHVIKKENKYWLRIMVKDGTIGYISADPQYTSYSGSSSGGGSSSSGSSKADRIINLAKSLQGRVTYKYGVRNPSKMIFDCSSFVEYVFEQNGVQLPWGTKTLKNKGTYVAKSNLKKGDLVFFSAGSGSINHVGIYIGNGKFIHNTPSAGGVTISSLNSGYWAKEYETARRVL